ncbi:MAG TPA: GNAT family N-acetyltransferase [Armatimonadota bacterium]|nr:GNAT family N-acetyltransferase [Armatimonadota bacterium]
MSDAITITTYDPATDYAAVTDLWRRSGLVLYPIDSAARLARAAAANAGLFLVARDGARVVGAVLGTTDGRALWVQHLAVDEAYRRQGLAGRLLDILEAEARARDLGAMLLLVLDENTGAVRFYERRGWLTAPGVRFMVYPLREEAGGDAADAPRERDAS